MERIDRPHEWEILVSKHEWDKGPIKWCLKCGANRFLGATQTLDGKPGCPAYFRRRRRAQRKPPSKSCSSGGR